MRDASTYRGARRNLCRSERGFGQWRLTIAHGANVEAKIKERAAQANSAREAMSQALAFNKQMRPDVVASTALLGFYRGQKRTRPVSRIIRRLAFSGVWEF